MIGVRIGRIAYLVLVVALFCPAGAGAEGPLPVGDGGRFAVAVDESAVFLAEPAGPDAGDLLRAAVVVPAGETRAHRLRVDVSPLLDNAVAFLRENGIPLRNESGRGARGVLVSATFRLRPDLPALAFRAGEENPDRLDAFYAPGSDASVALVLPVRQFQLRIEGGDDSEFGYYGIGGIQWRHPGRGLAAGLGVPVRLRNARGDVGVLFQVRMELP